MAYTLGEFCADCRRALAADAGHAGRERVRALLERLIADRDFVRAALGPDAPVGRRTLYEDPELGFVVLTYVQDEAHKSPPHDHGTSWAAYGQVEAGAEMTEYRRTDPGDDDDARLEEVRRYRLEPGKAGLYDTGAIHAIDYPAGARFVRVTGRDLEREPRLRFDLAGRKAIRIESASAS